MPSTNRSRQQRRRRRRRPFFSLLQISAATVFQDFRRDEDQQFAAIINTLVVLEQEADIRAGRRAPEPGGQGPLILRVDAADDHCAAVFNQNLGHHLLGVDGRAGRVFWPTLSLLTRRFMITLSSGVICGLTFRDECGFAERHAGRTAGGRLLIRISVPFDGRFDLVGRNHGAGWR